MRREPLALLAPSEANVKRPQARRLSELLRLAGHASCVPGDAVGARDPLVRGVTHDSGRVHQDDVFVAVRGRRDGADFAAEAVARGAAAVVAASEDRGLGVPWVRVGDDRAALADLAAAAWDHPSRDLAAIGITGTNGKTTVTEMVAASLLAAGRCPGVVGTLAVRWPGVREAPRRTTPEAPDLQAALAAMRAAGCGEAVLEVSSHGIDLQRVRAVDFAVVAFTNLSQDHLDWHGSVEEYYRSKRRLFLELAAAAPAVTCIDDAHGRRLADELRRADPSRRILTCGFAEDAELRILDHAARREGGATFRLAGGGVHARVRWSRFGRHEAANAAVAAGVASLLGVDSRVLADGLARTPVVPGRLELAAERGGVRVYVDYAHTPAALEVALTALRELGPRRLTCVFGCGGDRDREKREPMGRVVGRLADVAVLTSDNPRSEDPSAILDEVRPGLRGASAAVHVEVDRRQAIALALEGARPGDVVLVAGKGHETTQEIGDRVLPFDDGQVVRELLMERADEDGDRDG